MSELVKTHFHTAGSGTPLIFLHGLGSTGLTWVGQQAHFSSRYQVIALDLPGYGGTKPLAVNDFPSLATWLRESIEEHGWESPILVGTSYGGMIVQEYMAMFPAGAQAIVLTGTSPAFGKKDGEWQQKYIQARLGPLDAGNSLADLAPNIAKGLVGPAASKEAVEAVIADLCLVPEATFRVSVVSLLGFEQRKNLPNLTLPSLLLVGEADNNAPPNVMEKMASYIPDCDYVMLPGLGHIAHLEDVEQFNGALESFLEKHGL